MISCCVNSLNKSQLNIDAFSVLDTKNKLRFRMTYFHSTKEKSRFGLKKSQSVPYLKDKILKANGKPYHLLPDYDPTKIDGFHKHVFEGYENVEIPSFFGSNVKNSLGELFNKKSY